MLDVSTENLLQSILHTLAYADVFDYPLTAPEVYRYLTARKASLGEVAKALNDETVFSRVKEYFMLPGRQGIAEIRERRARTAARLWPKARRYGQMIAALPFVRMVAVTGSLAMNNADEGKDIDYMIIAAPGHLWTCRAFSLLIARIARLEGVSLCPNYLVTTHAMELKEHSLYVAHELAQMIPLAGPEVYHELRRLNDWTTDYLPNALTAPEIPQGGRLTREHPALRRVLEALLLLPFGKWFEEWEMKRKIARLTREQASSFESYFSADVCKGHIDRHGENSAAALAVRLEEATKLATTKAI